MKSKQIKLVLISAALASCNRQLIPQQKLPNNIPDSTLTAAPDYEDSVANNEITPCDCEATYYNLWNYSFDPSGVYHIYPIDKSYYFPSNREQKMAKWHGGNFIVRGGFGKSGVSVSS